MSVYDIFILRLFHFSPYFYIVTQRTVGGGKDIRKLLSLCAHVSIRFSFVILFRFESQKMAKHTSCSLDVSLLVYIINEWCI